MVEHVHALPIGYHLKEYTVTRILGFGGFGITYEAIDENLEKRVAIKEYLPSDLAVRTQESTVSAKSDRDQDGFEWGLDRFLNEAKVVAKFDHPNIVKIYRFFKSNGTGYIVMEYIDGRTLSSILRQFGKLDESQIRAWLWPIMEGLKIVHEAGFLHRDIKPQNIMIRDDDHPVLLDFGSARLALSGKTQSLTSVMTPGYAPLEQYSSHGDQGPWTDIYALGAVMYFCVRGEKPADALDRISKDHLVQLDHHDFERYSRNLCDGIMWALGMREDNRPQTLDQWLELLDDPSEEVTRVWKEPDPEKAETTRLHKPAQLSEPAISPCIEELPKPKHKATKPKKLSEVDQNPRTDGLRQKSVRKKNRAVKAGPGSNPNLDDGILNLIRPWFSGSFSAVKKWISFPAVNRSAVLKGVGTVFVFAALWFGLKNFDFSEPETNLPADEDQQYSQGQMYENGWGRQKDLSKAVELYSLAAERGHMEAQFQLARLFFHGEGVSQNYEKALDLYKRAADQGHMESQYMVGWMYFYGEGVAIDREESLKWFQLAAEQGHEKAKLYLQG